uniref:Uncharacterized protein n=1 Tax=Arundo donax TaxID=35708 RepID=A0A0A9Q947_ARUDO
MCRHFKFTSTHLMQQHESFMAILK